MNIIVASRRIDFWKQFLPLLEQNNGRCVCVENLNTAVREARLRKPDLAILDLNLQGREIRESVIQLLMVDAAIHTAVVSDMAAEDFHEFTEGLGILGSLPPEPVAEDIAALLRQLAQLN